MQRSIEADLAPRTMDHRGVPPLLAFIAGYVDATIFLAFGGLFVAQATGSMVVASSAFETGSAPILLVAAIPAFLLAGMVTSAVVRSFGTRRDDALATVLLVEAALIACLAIAALVMPGEALLPGLFGISAMGVQSALARLLLGSGSTNVMTSNLTQFSIDLEAALAGFAHGRMDRVALSSVARIGMLILGFAGGVAVGSLAFKVVGVAGAAVMVAVLIALALRIRQGAARAVK